MKKNILFILFFLLVPPAYSQKKQEITLEDIWSAGSFFEEHFEGLAFARDDSYYTYLDIDPVLQTVNLVKQTIQGKEKKIIVSSSLLINKQKIIIPESYEFSDDESKILLLTEKQPIYRRSFSANYFIFELNTDKIIPLSEKGKQSYATFSPDGKKVAFTRNNNIFIKELLSGNEVQITKDGEINNIVNGSTDWVYEEEFEFTKAFFWSPDSKKIAYYKFNEAQVKEYDMQIWKGLYPSNYKYKYPKAGEKNSEVTIYSYNVATKTTKKIDTGEEKDSYIPRIKWTQNPDILSIQCLNRKQNNFKILHANTLLDKVEVVYTEKNESYIEINDNLYYLKADNSFFLSSEQDGYRHFYHYSSEGKFINQITKGNWEVNNFVGIDEKKNLLYYTSTENSPLEKYFYSIDLTGNKKKLLTKSSGTHEITASSGYNYFIDNFSRKDTPPVVNLIDTQGNNVSTLLSNKILNGTLEKFQLSKTEFFTFKTNNDIELNGSMLKPVPFNPRTKYPVLIYIYGGPGSQNVLNHWIGPDYAWYQLLAGKGYVIVTIDNRGTGGRGAEFKKLTQHQLGKLETEDLINVAKYLGNLSYVDKSRIGIFGWSYGGYMSSLAMTIGADYFKAGIAVAPVISWRFYDSIYTERFLGDPKENASGYDDNSPLSHAAKLKGSFLLIHGTGDDNVHLQNSIEMGKALVEANKQFQVFHYPDKNHSLYGGNTRLHLYTMMTNFLIKNL